jgi:hypothetical protein
MAGILPNEGEALIAQWLCGNVVTDKGTDLELGLFTNSSISETTTHATLTEPTGGGYARINLTDASWTGAADTRSYAEQTFTATGSAMTGAVYGAFVCTKGATKRIISIELNPAGSVTLAMGDSYKVTPTIVVA